MKWKITKANPILLAEAKKPENAEKIEKELLAIKRRKKESKKKAGGRIKGRKSVMETRLRNLETVIETTEKANVIVDSDERKQPPEEANSLTPPANESETRTNRIEDDAIPSQTSVGSDSPKQDQKSQKSRKETEETEMNQASHRKILFP